MGVQAIGTELQDRAEVLSQLETDSQALTQFVSSGEGARIKARLTQIGRYWEELKESLQQLDGQLEESSSHQLKFQMSMEEVKTDVDDISKHAVKTWVCNLFGFLIVFQVKASLSELHRKLEHPIKSCTSSSETYKALQSHMVLSAF